MIDAGTAWQARARRLHAARRRQDRHDQRLPRRVVRRLHAAPRRRRVDRLRPCRGRSSPTAMPASSRCRCGDASWPRPPAATSRIASGCRRPSSGHGLPPERQAADRRMPRLDRVRPRWPADRSVDGLHRVLRARYRAERLLPAAFAVYATRWRPLAVTAARPVAATSGNALPSSLIPVDHLHVPTPARVDTASAMAHRRPSLQRPPHPTRLRRPRRGNADSGDGCSGAEIIRSCRSARLPAIRDCSRCSRASSLATRCPLPS